MMSCKEGTVPKTELAVMPRTTRKNKTSLSAQEGWVFKALTSSAPGTQAHKLFCQQIADSFWLSLGYLEALHYCNRLMSSTQTVNKLLKCPKFWGSQCKLTAFLQATSHPDEAEFVSNNLLSLLLSQHLQAYQALTAALQLPCSHPTITTGLPRPPCPRRKQFHSSPKPCKQEQQQNLHLNQNYVDWKIFKD